MATMRQWQLDIIVRLEETFNDQQVFEEGVPERVRLTMDNSEIVKPYVCVWFGQRTDGGPGSRALCGVRQSSHQIPFLVEVAAATGPVCNDAVVEVSRLLLGYRPAGQGELEESGAPTVRNPLDMSGASGRYQKPVAYTGLVDF